MSLNIICVIVTYSRLEILKESLSAVLSQTYPIGRIIVVDNASTDGTGDYLSHLSSENKKLQIVSMEHNTGGAGGFYEGIKRAALMHPDWIWIMDDDTIPHADALEKMIPYTADEKVGYLCSKVVWTDGNLHLMNKPGLFDRKEAKRAKTYGVVDAYSKDVVRITFATFVSLLIRGSIPYEVGLPYKEFFIWSDDVEYTKRIQKRGWTAYCITASLAVHKTPTNYISSLKVIPASAAWKLYYGVRNGVFINRKRMNCVHFFFSFVNKYRLSVHRLKKRHLPKEEYKILISAVRRGMWSGLTFNPKIDYLPNHPEGETFK